MNIIVLWQKMFIESFNSYSLGIVQGKNSALEVSEFMHAIAHLIMDFIATYSCSHIL